MGGKKEVPKQPYEVEQLLPCTTNEETGAQSGQVTCQGPMSNGVNVTFFFGRILVIFWGYGM